VGVFREGAVHRKRLLQERQSGRVYTGPAAVVLHRVGSGSAGGGLVLGCVVGEDGGMGVRNFFGIPVERRLAAADRSCRAVDALGGAVGRLRDHFCKTTLRIAFAPAG
jgi:hypothetical protein